MAQQRAILPRTPLLILLHVQIVAYTGRWQLYDLGRRKRDNSRSVERRDLLQRENDRCCLRRCDQDPNLRCHLPALPRRTRSGCLISRHLTDIDNDGDPDLFTGGETTAAVWLNDGDGNFAHSSGFNPPPAPPTWQVAQCAAWADVDGNGFVH